MLLIFSTSPTSSPSFMLLCCCLRWICCPDFFYQLFFFIFPTHLPSPYFGHPLTLCSTVFTCSACFATLPSLHLSICSSQLYFLLSRFGFLLFAISCKHLLIKTFNSVDYRVLHKICQRLG